MVYICIFPEGNALYWEIIAQFDLKFADLETYRSKLSSLVPFSFKIFYM